MFLSLNDQLNLARSIDRNEPVRFKQPMIAAVEQAGVRSARPPDLKPAQNSLRLPVQKQMASMPQKTTQAPPRKRRSTADPDWILLAGGRNRSRPASTCARSNSTSVDEPAIAPAE